MMKITLRSKNQPDLSTSISFNDYENQQPTGPILQPYNKILPKMLPDNMFMNDSLFDPIHDSHYMEDDRTHRNSFTSFNDKENAFYGDHINKKRKNNDKMSFNLHTGYGLFTESNNRNQNKL